MDAESVGCGVQGDVDVGARDAGDVEEGDVVAVCEEGEDGVDKRIFEKEGG